MRNLKICGLEIRANEPLPTAERLCPIRSVAEASPQRFSTSGLSLCATCLRFRKPAHRLRPRQCADPRQTKFAGAPFFWKRENRTAPPKRKLLYRCKRSFRWPLASQSTEVIRHHSCYFIFQERANILTSFLLDFDYFSP